MVVRWSLLFIACLSLCGPLAAADRDAPGGSATVVIEVANTGGIPDRTLRKAEALTSHIFEKAGINVIWIGVQGTGDDRAKATLNLILADALPERLRHSENAFGVTDVWENGSRCDAYIGYGRVQALSSRLQIAPELLLGHVAAHEIGHLLLGPNAHSQTGIMSPYWYASEQIRKAERGALVFNTEEAARMRRAPIVVNK